MKKSSVFLYTKNVSKDNPIKIQNVKIWPLGPFSYKASHIDSRSSFGNINVINQ
jgi:hypothetical protein